MNPFVVIVFSYHIMYSSLHSPLNFNYFLTYIHYLNTFACIITSLFLCSRNYYMLYYDLFYIQRFCYLSWISETWNELQLQHYKHKVSLSSQTFHSLIWQKDGLSTVPTFQYLLRQHHFSPLPSISIICLYQPQPKIDKQITSMAQVKKLILLPSVVLFGYLTYVHFIVASLIFLSPYRVHSSRHCFKPRF